MGGRMEIKYLPRNNRQKLNLYGSGKFDFHNQRAILKSSHVIASGAEDVLCSAFRYHIDKFVTWTVNFLQLNINDSSTEAQTIIIFLPKHTINAYYPDNPILNVELLQNLTDTSPEIKIILGNLNAKSLSWGCWLLDTKGAQFENLAADLDQVILNSDEDTYVSRTNGTTSALETSVISCHSTENYWKLLKSAVSDHYPILTTFLIDQELSRQNKRSWNFRKAKWEAFTQELESLCSESFEHKNLEELLSDFTDHIQKAVKHHIGEQSTKITRPNLYPEIFDILLRFKLNAVAFTADMKQAFLQIMLNEEDRDVAKNSLFLNDPSDESQLPSVYRFTRVLFGASSSPFLLAQL
ncbi:uncharacterized protein TNIN_428761 [Trichonephila inaurata madagascariensis]|uniref:Endonuclease/exonuclease/phosphatase domain-containing protein n=1 Tax=Trichonephila inaurata madagascariensis TaxID=2747483 RepID=A0A8X6YIK2_9ARAC|nr:uncharacterized protein TNIN_428761 [Trichonephila inaurata madagascariensis]